MTELRKAPAEQGKTSLRLAAEQALEALESLDCGDTYKTHNAASALRQALEKDADEWYEKALWGAQHVDNVDMSEERVHKTDKSIHEPVGYVTDSGMSAVFIRGINLEDDTPLYTAPPKAAEWVGLTDEELEDLEFASVDREYGHLDIRVLSRAIEAKLKEKNA